jgi:hypothetical protein
MQKNVGDGRNLPLNPLLQAAHRTKAEAIKRIFVAQAGYYYPSAQGISQSLAWGHLNLPATGVTGAP